MATGKMPKTIDCELVMTAEQLKVPPPPVGQPARWLPLKCAYVSYPEIARPSTASTTEVTGSHSGCPGRRGGWAAAAGSGGSGAAALEAAALGAGRGALPLGGVAETAVAVLGDRADAGRFEPAFEFAIADVSGDLAVTVRSQPTRPGSLPAAG